MAPCRTQGNGFQRVRHGTVALASGRRGMTHRHCNTCPVGVSAQSRLPRHCPPTTTVFPKPRHGAHCSHGTCTWEMGDGSGGRCRRVQTPARGRRRCVPWLGRGCSAVIGNCNNAQEVCGRELACREGTVAVPSPDSRTPCADHCHHWHVVNCVCLSVRSCSRCDGMARVAVGDGDQGQGASRQDCRCRR